MTLPAFCCRELPDGSWCYRLYDNCPIHRTESKQPEAAGERPRRERLTDRLYEMTDRLLDGRASPSGVTKVIRAWTGISKIPPSPEEEERQRDIALRTMALDGLMMAGFAPRDTEEWFLAVEQYGLAAVLENFRFWRVMPPCDPIPVEIVEQLLDLAAKLNYRPFRVPSRMLNPESLPGEPLTPLLAYPRIDHDPDGTLGPRAECEEFRYDWVKTGIENGVDFSDVPGIEERLKGGG